MPKRLKWTSKDQRHAEAQGWFLACDPSGHFRLAQTDCWKDTNRPRFKSDRELKTFVRDMALYDKSPDKVCLKALVMVTSNLHVQASTCTCNRPNGSHARGCNWLMIPNRGGPPDREPV